MLQKIGRSSLLMMWDPSAVTQDDIVENPHNIEFRDEELNDPGNSDFDYEDHRQRCI